MSRAKHAEQGDGQVTKKRGAGPSFEWRQEKGAREASARGFPRWTPDSPLPSPTTSLEPIPGFQPRTSWTTTSQTFAPPSPMETADYSPVPSPPGAPYPGGPYVDPVEYPWLSPAEPVPFGDDEGLAPWDAPSAPIPGPSPGQAGQADAPDAPIPGQAGDADAPYGRGPNGTPLLPSGGADEDPPQVQTKKVILTTDFFRIDYNRAREYAKMVKQEMDNGHPYSLSKGQEVYAKFTVPYGACVFWDKYQYENVYLGGGDYGIVLLFKYNNRDLAVKFEAYMSGDDTKYKDMVNEIAINALINQLPAERRFGVVEMVDWARCYFSFERAIGAAATDELAKKRSVVKKAHTWQMIVFERAGQNLMNVFERVYAEGNQQRTFEFWSAAYLQILVTQMYLWRNFEFRHLDLHWQNILTKPEPNPTKTHILYILHDMRGSTVHYRVPLSNTDNLLMMISDMGRASAETMQIIRDSAYEDPQTLKEYTELDLNYIEDIFALTMRDRITDQRLHTITGSDRALMERVYRGIVGTFRTPGIGHIDFEKLILETLAFDQYKTDQPQPRATDRVMEVAMREFMTFTEIKANRSSCK